MEDRIDIGVYVDNSDANRKFKETIGSLENLLRFETILNGKGTTAAFSKMAAATKPYIAGIEMATKASKKFNNILADQNKGAVSSLFGKQGPSAMNMLVADAKKTGTVVAGLKGVADNIKIIGTEMSPLRNAWETSKKGVLGFNGALLSTLFFGMEMQRIFGGALKSIFEGYRKIIPENHEFNKMVTQLSANWEFFKFQLADALGKSTLFQTFVQIAISLLKVFQGLPEPLKAFAGYLLAAGAALGVIMMYFGVLGLGVAGLNDLAVGAAKLGPAFARMLAWMATPVGIAFLALAATIALIATAMHTLYTKTETGAKKFDMLKEAFAGIGDQIMNLINTILSPFGIKLDGLGQAFVLLGAIAHNIFVIIGSAITWTLAIFQSFVDIVIGAAKVLGDFMGALLRFATGDFEGAAEAFDNAWANANDTIDKVKQNILDAAANQDKLNESWMSGIDIENSLKEYNNAIAKDSYDKIATDSSGVVNNYIVIDGAAQSTSFTQQQREFMQTIQGTSMVSGGSKNGWTS